MTLKTALLTLLAMVSLPALAQERIKVDVAVYGATPGGIAAALSAARGGAKVLLIESTQHIGGLTTSGLSHTDFRTYEGLTGEFLRFSQLVETHYRQKYGPDSQQLKDCRKGTHAEPHVNERVLEEMLSECGNITVRKGLELSAVAMLANPDRIEGLSVVGERGAVLVFATVFIDGTYEGDLMSKTTVKWRVGREGKQEYNESLAPDQPDKQLQAYNFRFVMTKDPANRAEVIQPAGYKREDFEGVLPLLGTKIKTAFGYPTGCLFKAQIPMIPNGKYDINDVSGGSVRLSMPGENLDWPDGFSDTRAKIFQTHLRYNVGLIWFIQNDPAVPEKFRDEARQYGWCKDEFTDNGHLPWQLYVREARRMVGRYVFTENDTATAPGDARAVLRTDSIAMGDYGPNCHGTAHEGPRFGGKHVGEFYKSVPPYQISYGTIVPKEIDNLLVPVAASASHVGFCALRLEPVWMSLGQAAGTAARLAIEGNTTVGALDVGRIQSVLHTDGAATIYVSDIPCNSPLFNAVQWLGARGGLHGLNPPPAGGPRGKNIEGQYFHAFPNHAFEADRVVEKELIERWVGLLSEAKRAAAKVQSAAWDGWTRGKIAARIYELAR